MAESLDRETIIKMGIVFVVALLVINAFEYAVQYVQEGTIPVEAVIFSLATLVALAAIWAYLT